MYIHWAIYWGTIHLLLALRDPLAVEGLGDFQAEALAVEAVEGWLGVK